MKTHIVPVRRDLLCGVLERGFIVRGNLPGYEIGHYLNLLECVIDGEYFYGDGVRVRVIDVEPATDFLCAGLHGFVKLTFAEVSE